jgi:hypothetical protein
MPALSCDRKYDCWPCTQKPQSILVLAAGKLLDHPRSLPIDEDAKTQNPSLALRKEKAKRLYGAKQPVTRWTWE